MLLLIKLCYLLLTFGVEVLFIIALILFMLFVCTTLSLLCMDCDIVFVVTCCSILVGCRLWYSIVCSIAKQHIALTHWEYI